MPGREMEFEVHRCELFPGVAPAARRLAQFEEMPVLALRGAFDEHETVLVDGVERAASHLARLLGKFRADLAVFGDVQVLQRAGAQRHPDPDRGIVGEQQFAGVVVLRRQLLLEAVGQVVVGEADLVAKDHLGIGEGMGDGAGADVGVEHAGIQHQQLDEGGEAALTRLQDHVLMVHVFKRRLLRGVHREGDAPAVLVGDDVEVVQSPPGVGVVIDPHFERDAHSLSLSRTLFGSPRVLPSTAFSRSAQVLPLSGLAVRSGRSP